MFKKLIRLLVTRPKMSRLTAVVCMIFIGTVGTLLITTVRPAVAATNSTINFQARLLNSSGAIVPDGNYFLEFKLYTSATSTGTPNQGACTMTPGSTTDPACVWVETYGTGNAVRVVDGYLTVNLGSLTAFGSSINWDQNLWLSMRVGGDGGSPSWETTEMTPRLPLTAVPYAFRSATLVGGTGSNVTTLDAGTPSGTNAIHLPAASGTVCLQGSSSCNFAPSTGGAGYVQLQGSTPGTAQGTSSTGNFNIAGTGIVGTELQTPLVDSTGTLSLGTSTATGVTLGNASINTNVTGSNVFLNGNTSVSAGDTFSVVSGYAAITGLNVANANPTLTIDSHSSGASPLVVKSAGTTVLTVANGGATTIQNVNSTAAFVVQNTLSVNAFTVDAVDSQILTRGINSVATVGSNIFSSISTCSGTNWTVTTTAVHTAGSATALTCTSPTIASNTNYLVTFTTGGSPTTGTGVTVSLGGVSGIKVYGNTSVAQVQEITSSTTGSFNFVPDTNWNGTLSAISVQQFTATTNSVVTVDNSDGSVGLEIRAGGSGLANTFVGQYAGQFNTTGSDNVGFGQYALQDNTTGQDNSAFGQGALNDNTTGNYNTAVGEFALLENTTGSNNTAVGQYTLPLNSTGSQNLAIGETTLYNNTSGSNNVGLGANALQNNTTGSYNIGIGIQAALANTSGTQNIGIGYTALDNNTTGSQNIAIGGYAVSSSSTSNNIGIGYQAGEDAGGNSVGVGYGALQDTSGTNDTALGYDAGYYVNGSIGPYNSVFGVNNSTVIGSNAQVQESNALILGAAGANAVNIGIGTPNPTNLVSVSPTVYSTGTASQTASTTVVGAGSASWSSSMVGDEFVFASGAKYTIVSFTDATHLVLSASATNSSQSYYIQQPAFQVTSSGNVGIGTVNPSANLQVATQTNNTTAFQVDNSSGAAIFNVDTTNGRIGTTDQSTSSSTNIKLQTGNVTGGSGLTTGSINIQSGQGTGTSTSTGNITIDSGQASSGGTAGTITIGSGNASSVTVGRTGSTTVNIQGGSGINIGSGGVANTIQIGNTSGGVAQIINVGNNGTASSSTTVTIGSTIGASPVTIQGGSSGILVSPVASNTAFQVQNGSSIDLLNVDSTGGYVIDNGTTALGNELVNPGFESIPPSGSMASGSAGWTGNTSTNIVNDPTNAHSGNGVLEITAVTNALSKYYAVTPGQQVYMEGYVKTSGTGQGGFFLEFTDQNKANASYADGTWTGIGSSYTLETITTTVPAGRYFLRIGATVRSGATGTWYFDDLYLKKSTEQAPMLFQNSVNSANALQVQDTSNNTVLNVSTSTDKVGIGTASPNYALDVQGGDINTSGVYREGGTNVGQSVTCTGGQVLQNQVVAGGIVTGGSCVANGGGGGGGGTSTLQNDYNNSSSPASIVTTSVAKGIVFEAGSGDDSTTLFQIQSTANGNLFTADSSNMRIDIGSIGTPTSQLYVSGQIPSAATGSVGTAAAPYDVVVNGKYAYVVDGTANEFQIFDISNPSSPVLIETKATQLTGPNSLAISGHYLFIDDFGSSGTNSGIEMWDISNPTSPQSLGSISGSFYFSGLYSIYAQGRYVYGVDDNDGEVYKIDTNGGNLSVVASQGTPGSEATSIYVLGANVYVTDEDVGKMVILNANTMNQVGTVSFNASSEPFNVVAQGNYAYVTTTNTGFQDLEVVNVSNPASPTIAGSVATNGIADAVYVQGRYAYTANESSNVLQTFDVSNPASPTSLGYVSAGSGANALYVQGRYGYVVSYTADTLQTFNLGGSYIQQLEAGGAEVGTLAVDANENVAGDANIQGGLSVGQAVQINGDLGVTGNEELDGSTLQVQTSGGTNVLSANGSSAAVGIGITGSTILSSSVDIADSTGNIGQTVKIGSLQSTSTTTVQGGTGGITVQAAASSTIAIGTNNVATKTIQIGSVGTTAQATTVHIADTTGNAAQTVTVGSLSSTSTTTVQGGTGGAILQAAASSTVSIGTNNVATKAIQIGSVGTTAQATTLDIADSTGAAAQTVKIGSLQSTSGTTIQSGSNALALTTNGGNITLNAGGGLIAIGDTSLTGLGLNLIGPTYTNVTRGVTIGTNGSGITLLDLDASTNQGTETSGNCSTAINPGGIYYSEATASNNTSTQDLRGCINGNWQDIVTADQLGVMLLGVVENSGNNPGDLGGITGMANGPCKVSWASTTSVSVAPCVAYSGGRKVVVSSAVSITGLNAGNSWYDICMTGTNGAPAASTFSSTQAGGLPAFSATSPILCLAAVKTGAGATISNIYDTRTFVSSTKQFATFTSGTQTGVAPGMIVINNSVTSEEVTTTNASQQQGVRGVVVVGSSSNSTSTINAIIATGGPAFVEGNGGTGGIDDGAETSSTGYGLAESNDQGSTYLHGVYLGLIEQLGADSACNATTNCQFSFLVSVSLE